MQIDAATDFARDWDDLAVSQWASAENEYAVLTNVPERDRNYGAMGDGAAEAEVPRQCSIRIGSEGVPLYESGRGGGGGGRAVADGKAVGLARPLLSTTISSSFAFSKCHLETNVPHDPHAAQLLENAEFPRFARMWTRGYDAYTPAANIVFRGDGVSGLHPLHRAGGGHGEGGGRKWPRNDGERRDAHVRMKVVLNIHRGVVEAMEASSSSSSSSSSGGVGGGGEGGGGGIGDRIETARANLGIYGLGRRRTLDQLLDFAGVALPGGDDPEYPAGHGNDVAAGGGGAGPPYCADPGWVPYDASVSPRANLYDGTGRADDLDPEPIFALRTLPDATGGRYDRQSATGNAAWGDVTTDDNDDAASPSGGRGDGPYYYSTVFLLWVVGLRVWYGMFVGDGGSGARRGGAGKLTVKNSAKKPTRGKVPLSERVLKNV
jgi:hypothetical protein